jgi:hypothetical protein
MEEGRRVVEILKDKYVGKRPLGRPELRWQDNIIIGLKETGVIMSN